MSKNKLLTILFLALFLVSNLGYSLASSIDSVEIPVGYDLNHQTGIYYYYGESLSNWQYYNPYFETYIEANTNNFDDGWNNFYSETLEEWLAIYYDRENNRFLHYNDVLELWYQYDVQDKVWYLNDENNIQKLSYNPESNLWTYGEESIEKEIPEIEVTDDLDLLIEWYFSNYTYQDWFKYEQGYEYEWDTAQWEFDDSYYEEEISDKDLDELFDTLIDNIWQYYTDMGGVITTPGYTLMIYLNGTNLESEMGLGTLDIQEMWQTGSNQNINIILATGGTNKWLLPEINPEMNQYWKVEKEGLTLIENVSSVYEESICSASFLSEFIEYSHSNFPADKYAFIYWNHGGGAVGGYGHDEILGGNMTLNDILVGMHQAKENTEIEFELIGFDACLMANLETMSMLSNYGKYFIASEENEPGHGWNYTPIVQAISNKPWISGRDLGEVIIKSYQEFSSLHGTDESITLSLIDLAKINDLIISVEEFVEEIMQNDYEFGDLDRFAKLVQARSRAESYGGNYPSDMVDLYDLANHFDTLGIFSSRHVKSNIDNAVIHNLSSAGNENAKGISIYFPSINSERFMSDWNSYKDLYFSRIYRDFIGRYLSKLMSKKEFRALSISDDEIIREDRMFAIDLNIHDIPKLKDVRLNLYYFDNEKEYYLGNKGVNFDLINDSINASNIESWYAIDGNFVSATTLNVDEIEYLLVDVFYDSEDGFLVYEANGIDGYEFKHLYISPENTASREIIVELNKGDKIDFRHKDEKSGSIIYQSINDIKIEIESLTNIYHGFEFSTMDVLGRLTKSKMYLINEEQPLAGFSPLAPIIVVGILLMSVFILLYLIKSD